jgi:hypothetical protein
MQSSFASFLAQSDSSGFPTSSQWIMIGLITLAAVGMIVLLFKIKPAA